MISYLLKTFLCQFSCKIVPKNTNPAKRFEKFLYGFWYFDHQINLVPLSSRLYSHEMIDSKPFRVTVYRKLELVDTFVWKSVELENPVDSYSKFLVSGPKMDHYAIRP